MIRNRANRTTQTGMALLASLVLVTLLAMTAQAIYVSTHQNQQQNMQWQVKQSTSLEHIRQGLLMFASLQGYNSHTQVGHLPCPSNEQGGFAQTTCTHSRLGHLPVQTIAKTNYFNPGISALWNPKDLDTNKHWMYAVSEQVVQPNTLGWSQWVDFNKPSLTVRTPSAVYSHVVALVASTLKATANAHEIEASEPLVVITQPQVEQAIQRVQKAHMQNTLNAWLGPYATSNENLKQLNTVGSTTTWQAHDSKCACRCTKTQCTCQCEQEGQDGQWVSNAPCQTEQAHCISEENQNNAWASRCTSSAKQACVFKGPAQLESGWPIASYDPPAFAGKACRPTTRNQCPLSPEKVACLCTFSWPDNAKAALEKFSITSTPTPEPSFTVVVSP